MATQFLLVDTNIISHALTPNQTLAYTKLFRELEKEYKFVVTGFTQYELLCSSNRERQQKIIDYVRDDMNYVALTQPLMDFAARVHNLYKVHESTKGLKISAGDIINAAFCIAKGNCSLISIDNNDYPRPFFEEVARKRITYDSGKNKEVTDTLYILKPDTENIKSSCDRHKQ
ncbi:MAG TPA: type II toxin-antitoxin system VapC family toxin [Patescibacteria group bacterium]|nr:type II toxin-antitoxin system VapC family toxin [Patescibacteria group bacterium]